VIEKKKEVGKGTAATSTRVIRGKPQFRQELYGGRGNSHKKGGGGQTGEEAKIICNPKRN